LKKAALLVLQPFIFFNEFKKILSVNANQIIHLTFVLSEVHITFQLNLIDSQGTFGSNITGFFQFTCQNPPVQAGPDDISI
jgi:hypothetical protein